VPIELQIKVVGDTGDEIRDQLHDVVSKSLIPSDESNAPLAQVTPIDSKADAVATKKIDMVFSRVGSNIRTLIQTASSFEDGYQTADLAEKMGVTPVQLRSYAANLGRTMKSVNATLGDDTPIYAWDEQHGKWVMPEAIRQAVIAKTA
jgi:hypothetical protein